MTYDEQLPDRLRSVLDGEPGLSERWMFGGLGFSVDAAGVGTDEDLRRWAEVGLSRARTLPAK